MPLSDLLEQGGRDVGRRREAVVALRRGRPGGPDLAELAGDYIYGNGFIHQRLEVRLPGRYHFQWRNDVHTNDLHEDDQNESRGQCSIVDGVLRLVPEGPFSSDLRQLMRNDFVPVRWAGRRYLVPEKERLIFCSVVNRGGEPKYMRSGPFSLDGLIGENPRRASRKSPKNGPPSSFGSPWRARSSKSSRIRRLSWTSAQRTDSDPAWCSSARTACVLP